jgi:hypothetical protein
VRRLIRPLLVGLGVVTVDPDLCHRLVPALNRLCAALAKVATAGEAGALPSPSPFGAMSVLFCLPTLASFPETPSFCRVFPQLSFGHCTVMGTMCGVCVGGESP